MAFLLTVMLARPSAASASLPVMAFGRRSTRNRWQSVPPETMRRPRRAERGGHDARVAEHLLLIALEIGGERLLERDRLGGDQRASAARLGGRGRSPN